MMPPTHARSGFEGRTCFVISPSSAAPGFLIGALEHAAKLGLHVVTAIVPPASSAQLPVDPALLRKIDALPPSERTVVGPLERLGQVTTLPLDSAFALVDADVILDLRGAAAAVGDLRKQTKVLTFDFMLDTEAGWRWLGLPEWLDLAEDVPLALVRKDRTRQAVAFGRSKIHRHSYRATREQALTMSVHVLLLGLRNVLTGAATNGGPAPLPPSAERGYSSTDFRRTVRRRRLARLRGRLLSTTWRVGFVPPIDLGGGGTTALDLVELVRTPPAYAFMADPAVVDSDTILCEALDARSRKGRLIRVRGQSIDVLDTSSIGSGHLSYPHVVAEGARRYLLPEMSAIGPQRLFPFDSGRGLIGTGVPLGGLEELRLVDATLLNHDGRWWLFAGVGLEGADRERRDRARPSYDTLFLWHAPRLLGPYEAHPRNPVILDPGRARMAGPVIRMDGRLYRLGQDNRDRYGDGITVAEVTALDTESYRETPLLRLRVRGHRGPHTLERMGERFVVDYFDERFSVSDSWRRLGALLTEVRVKLQR
jgi:hypothetical protein